jgi:hypothetical protein
MGGCPVFLGLLGKSLRLRSKVSCFVAAFTLVLFFARLYVKFYDDHFRLFSVYLFFAPRSVYHQC